MADSAPRPLAMPVFLLVLVGLFAAGLLTLGNEKTTLLALPRDRTALTQGGLASEGGKHFEKHFSLQDAAVGAWGSLRFALFHTGNEGVVIGKDGWLYTDEEFRQPKDAAAELASKLALIDQTNRYLHSRGIELVVALIPAKARVYPEGLGSLRLPPERAAIYEQFRHELRARHVYAPDLLPIFLGHKSGAPLFLHRDTHWTPEGADLAAHFLADSMHRDCAEVALPATKFTRRADEPSRYVGDLDKFIPLGLLADMLRDAPDHIRIPHTDRVEESSPDALFGAEATPVVLVGTSYSQHAQFDFDGALEQALSADVLNLAEEGKGPMVPMMSVLGGKQLDEAKPNLVIWEIPERYLTTHYDTKFPLPEQATSDAPLHCRVEG